MAARNPSASWCLVRNDKVLMRAIRSRIRTKGLKLVEIARATDIRVDRISKFLHQEKYTKHITQFETVRLANFLGIEIKLDVKFKD